MITMPARQPSSELLEATRRKARSILGTWSERQAAVNEWLRLVDEESGGSEQIANRLTRQAELITMEELNAETRRRWDEEDEGALGHA